jgi:hypothetical protein
MHVQCLIDRLTLRSIMGGRFTDQRCTVNIWSCRSYDLDLATTKSINMATANPSRVSLEVITGIVIGLTFSTTLKALWDYIHIVPSTEDVGDTKEDITDGVTGLIGESTFRCNRFYMALIQLLQR